MLITELSKDVILSFSKLQINGTISVKKDNLEQNVKGDPHLHPANLEKKQKLGADIYNQEVVSSPPIERGLAKMNEKDKQTLTIRFNNDYYLPKNECLYSKFGDLLTLQK